MESEKRKRRSESPEIVRKSREKKQGGWDNENPAKTLRLLGWYEKYASVGDIVAQKVDIFDTMDTFKE